MTKETLEQKKFWSRVKKLGPDECWEWQRSTATHGYGYISIKGKNYRAHRYSWEISNGPIPEGLLICHKCDNPPCVNPNHLFLGTHKDNVLDMVKKNRHYKQKLTHCPQGHEYIKNSSKKHRACSICITEQRAIIRATKPTRKSNYQGVTWHRCAQRWQVLVIKDTKRTYVGLFDLELEAAKAYKKIFIKLYGPEEYKEFKTLTPPKQDKERE